MMSSVGDGFLVPIADLQRRKDCRTVNANAISSCTGAAATLIQSGVGPRTHFGLQSGGRTESILMSMPPLAIWPISVSPSRHARDTSTPVPVQGTGFDKRSAERRTAAGRIRRRSIRRTCACVLAQAALEQLHSTSYGSFRPSSLHSHSHDAPEHRLAMTRLAFAIAAHGDRRTRLHRPGPTYTIDTLRELKPSIRRRALPGHGEDQAVSLTRWREWEGPGPGRDLHGGTPFRTDERGRRQPALPASAVRLLRLPNIPIRDRSARTAAAGAGIAIWSRRPLQVILTHHIYQRS